MLTPGDRIGDWEIVLPLGQGGMGSVYRCRHALSDRIEAAVKVLKPTEVRGARERFIREAEALHSLQHPAIVRISGFGEDTNTGLLFLAMELVHGQDFDQLLVHQTFPRERVARIFADLADGLAYAHARGIAHRDLKPANLMLRADGSPVLLDFGIAVQEGQDRLTQEGVVPGTVSYAAPEQVTAGRGLDPALTDVYALGQVLCECLTGTFTFPHTPDLNDHRRAVQILRKKLKMQALDPGPTVSRRVRELVRTATAPEPGDRGPALDRWRGVLLGGSVFATGPDGPDDEEQTALIAAGPSRPPAPVGPAEAETVSLGPDDTGSVRTGGPPWGLVGGVALGVVVLGAALLAVLMAGGAAAWWTLAPVAEVAPQVSDVPLGDVLSGEAPTVVPEPTLPDVPAPDPTPVPVATRATRAATPVVVAAPQGEGRLVVSSDRTAQVYLDGTYLRDTPLTRRLPTGRYAVELRSGASRRAFEVQVDPDEVVRRVWSFTDGEWRSFDGGMDERRLPPRPEVDDAQQRLERSPQVAACLGGRAGTVQLAFMVAPDGSVVAEGLSGDARGTDLDACLKAAVRTLQFDPSQAGAAVTVRLGG